MYNPIYKNVSLSLSSSIKHKKIEIALISFLKWNCIFMLQSYYKKVKCGKI